MIRFLDSKKNRFLIATGLLVVAVILYIAKPSSSDGSAGVNGENENVISIPKEVILSELERKIDSVLHSFNISDSWITRVNEKAGEENLLFNKNVSVPPDLSIAFLNLDITRLISELRLKQKVFEDPKSREVTIFIQGLNGFNDTNTFARLNFSYDRSLSRDAASVVLIFDNIKKIVEKERAEVLKAPQNFNFVLPLSFEDSDVQAAIIESGKNYVIYYVVGDEDNYTADFRSNMSERVWKTRITSLHSEYPGASGVIFRNPDKQFEFERSVRDQFLKYNPNSYRDTLIKVFEPEYNDPTKVDELFRLIIKSAKEGNKVQFYLVDFSYRDFKRFLETVKDMKKKGYRFETFRRGINLKRNLAPVKAEDEETENEE